MFEPRLTPPTDEPFWIRTFYGGLNPYPSSRAGASALPNCTSYAFGRFYEILYKEGITECMLSGHGNACSWFTATDKDEYERGLVPALGAVICWAGGTGAGHVAIVEEIYDDGSILTSESGWQSSSLFWTKRRTNENGRWGQKDTYEFQGFIYNPAVDRISHKDRFMRAAIKQIGLSGDWTFQSTGCSRNSSWSGAFVVACAKEAGVLNVIVPNTFSCSSIGRAGVLRNMGEWYKGPGQGSYVEPEKGDIVLFRNSRKSSVNTYVADRCGIVTEYTNGIITCIEGDYCSKVSSNTYYPSSSAITGIFRPDWSQVDTEEGEIIGYHKVQGLYTDLVKQEDAAAKEVCYITEKGQPTLSDTGLRLSLINYTGLLGSMYSVFGGQLATATDSNTADQQPFEKFSGSDTEVVSIDGLSQNESICFTFFRNKGLSVEVTCGILGNIAAESSFNPASLGDRIKSGPMAGTPTSFGICQWHDKYDSATNTIKPGRGTAMKNSCGPDWSSNLTGQLEYLWMELNSTESKTLSALLAVPDNLTGYYAVREATGAFMIKFERPADQSDSAVDKRTERSMKIYNKLVLA